MSETGGIENGNGGGAPAETAAPDSGGQTADPLAGRFDEFRDEIRSTLTDGLSQFQQSLQPQQDDTPQDPYAEFFQGFEDDQPEYEPDPSPFQNPQDALRQVASLAETAAEHKLGPQLQAALDRIESIETRNQANLIATQYPALRDPAVAKQAFDQAQAQAEAMGMPELAGKPQFILQTYLAGQAQAQAQQQTAAGAPDDIRLEGVHGGGGPAPGFSSDDEGDAIVAQAQRKNILSSG